METRQVENRVWSGERIVWQNHQCSLGLLRRSMAPQAWEDAHCYANITSCDQSRVASISADYKLCMWHFHSL